MPLCIASWRRRRLRCHTQRANAEWQRSHHTMVALFCLQRVAAQAALNLVTRNTPTSCRSRTVVRAHRLQPLLQQQEVAALVCCHGDKVVVELAWQLRQGTKGRRKLVVAGGAPQAVMCPNMPACGARQRHVPAACLVCGIQSKPGDDVPAAAWILHEQADVDGTGGMRSTHQCCP